MSPARDAGSFIGEPNVIEEKSNEDNQAGSLLDTKTNKSDPNVPVVFIDPADDIPNNTDKCIDFTAQL